jgi:osmotically inducible lipoprotein OsmB
MKNTTRNFLIAFICAGLSACAGWTPAEQGTAIGGVTGAAVGNVVTGGSALGTVGGAAVGGVIGHEIGENQVRNRYYRSRY